MKFLRDSFIHVTYENKKDGSIIIGSMVRDTISCVFVPQSVGANQRRAYDFDFLDCYSLKATTKNFSPL